MFQNGRMHFKNLAVLNRKIFKYVWPVYNMNERVNNVITKGSQWIGGVSDNPIDSKLIV